MKQPRLRLLLTADAVGGVWQYSIDLARGLSRHGVETVLAVLGPSPSAAQVTMAEGVKGLTLLDTGLELDWLASNPAAIRKAGDAIAGMAVTHSADVVQLNSPALAAETDFAMPVVAVNHSCLASWWETVKGEPLDEAYAWRSELGTRGLHRADRVVTPTAAFAEATMRAHGLPLLPTAVHNGRTPLKLPKVAPHDFGFTAGRLWDVGKNVSTLDRAAAELAIPFYAAGPIEGPNGDAIRLEHARSLGNLDEQELARWLAARPVFVSAALYEPFGLAVLEAAAAGCPLVLSDIPTFRELWDGVATFVPATDPCAFAKNISAIVGDAHLRSMMGAAARERAARYTPEAMAGAMLGIYRDLMAERAERGRAAA